MENREKIINVLGEHNLHWKGKLPSIKFREDTPSLIANKILIITGIRRSGKSYLVYNLIKSLLKKGINKFNILYVNFFDPILKPFSNPENIEDLISTFAIIQEKRGNRKQEIFIFLDEIQEVKEWWKWIIRRVEIKKDKNIILTGSNSSLLKEEFSTYLTGRNIKFVNYPLSFKEFLNWKEFKTDLISINIDKEKLLRLFDEYFNEGSFPEIVLYRQKEILKQLYEDILWKDIIRRNKIRESAKMSELSYYLISNTTSEFSCNKLGKILNLHEATVKEYIKYIENAYLVQTLDKFSYKVKEQISYNKKIYCVDNGLVNAVSFKISQDKGKLLENLVFGELKRRNKEIYYFKDTVSECDFVIREGGKIAKSIQVAYEIDIENEKRELRGLLKAMDKFDLKEGFILTYNQDEKREIKGKKINILPLWKWLLSEKL